MVYTNKSDLKITVSKCKIGIVIGLGRLADNYLDKLLWDSEQTPSALASPSNPQCVLWSH